MDRGTDPNSIAVELITLVIRTSSYFSALRRWGLVSFKDLTGIAVFYHEIRQFSMPRRPRQVDSVRSNSAIT